MRACIAIPPQKPYPHVETRAGLARLGYGNQESRYDLEADILVTWSPWVNSDRIVLERAYREAGKPVIVCENGWLSPIQAQPYFQVALDGWNGTGTFPAGGPERWRTFGLTELPWTHRSGYALVIGQRGHPDDPRTAVPGWHESVQVGVRALRRGSGGRVPLFEDLMGAAECHVWTSTAAAWAVLYGVPVIQHGPNLMVSALASRPGEPLYRGARQTEFERLAWAQWNSAEIATGEPFARLLQR